MGRFARQGRNLQRWNFGQVLMGIYTSYYLNVPSGPCIVLISFGFFVLAVLFSPSQGLLARPEAATRATKLLRQFKAIHIRELGVIGA
jgi:hypothetical protein